MREYRGQRADNGEWVEGFYVCIGGKFPYIFTGLLDLTGRCTDLECFEVIPETVGQYIGLTDKNGKKIFEGDVVKGKDNLVKDLEVYGYIDYENGSFVIVGDSITHYRWLDYDVEVIGNIHDNPELLKGGAEE